MVSLVFNLLQKVVMCFVRACVCGVCYLSFDMIIRCTAPLHFWPGDYQRADFIHWGSLIVQLCLPLFVFSCSGCWTTMRQRRE